MTVVDQIKARWFLHLVTARWIAEDGLRGRISWGRYLVRRTEH